MGRRRVQVVLLCEDGQHEAFLRRVFVAIGWDSRGIRVEKSPKGRGSGEQWVRARYADEVRKLRGSAVARALVVAIDEDVQGEGRREAQLAETLVAAGSTPRGASEPILHAIPARNIEAWIAYCDGRDVDAQTVYAKLERERDCAPMAAALGRMCRERKLREPAPPSLQRACAELRSRLP
jgi:hypothetical protein